MALPYRFVRAAGLAVFLVAGFSGCMRSTPSIQNKGSDTMVELAQAWSEAYRDATIEVSGGGSGHGISSLISGTVDVANSSRPISETEAELAKKTTGKDPLLHVVGYDALAIYIHKDNPLEEITLEQLADIYGEKGTITKWSQLGVKVPGCDSDEIQRISRQNNSGTYEYFREHVLGKNVDYKLGSIDASGSKDLVTLVSKTPCAIGYSGMGYKTPEVKFVKVKNKAAQGILPSVEAVHGGSYPISRPLYMYTLEEPATASLPKEKEAKKLAIHAFIEWVRSDAGQKVCGDVGYVPLKPEERSGKAGARPTKS